MAENNQQDEAIQRDQSDLPTPHQGIQQDHPSDLPNAQQALGFDGINTGGSRPFAFMGGGGKREWPEVVGLTVEAAKEKIKKDMPRARFQVVPPNCFVTMDFDTGRVRLYVDSSNKVIRPPTIG